MIESLPQAIINNRKHDMVDFNNCDGCNNPKATRSHTNRKGSNHPNKQGFMVGEYFNVDLIGPIAPWGVGSEKYIVNCVYFIARYGMVYCIKDKTAETLTVTILKLVNHMKSKFDVTVKYIHCDQ